MLRSKLLLLAIAIVSAIAVFSFSLDNHTPSKSRAVTMVGLLYQQEMKRFDSALEAYAKYFPDSSYETRFKTFQHLVWQSKHIECLYGYFHHEVAAATLFLTPRFQKRESGPPFPDNWIF